MSDLEIKMEVIKVTVLRCPTCGYERRMPGIYDPEYIDRACPACVDPGRWAGWASKRGADPVRFNGGTTDGCLPNAEDNGAGK